MAYLQAGGKDDRARAGNFGRGALVLLLVLALHLTVAQALRSGLAQAVPQELTQTTMIAALLRPPPPPASRPVVATPRTPTIAPAPVAAAPEPAPAPVEPSTPEPAPPEQAPPEAAPVPELPSALANVSKLPVQGRIAYRMHYSRLPHMEALTFVDWSIDAERGTYQLWLRTVDPPGLLDLKSYGELKPFGIAPLSYVERFEVVGQRESSVDFDWSTRIARFAGPRAGPPAPFTEGTQDPLSLQFHLPLLAQTFPWRFVPGAEVQFSVAYRRVETYALTVVGWETVRIAGQDVKALRVERRRAPDVRREVQLWMAPEFDWLTVKLRFVNTNDDVWESVLAHLPGRQPTPADPAKAERITP